jgi:hypothetical protein
MSASLSPFIYLSIVTQQFFNIYDLKIFSCEGYAKSSEKHKRSLVEGGRGWAWSILHRVYYRATDLGIPYICALTYEEFDPVGYAIAMHVARIKNWITGIRIHFQSAYQGVR